MFSYYTYVDVCRVVNKRLLVILDDFHHVKREFYIFWYFGLSNIYWLDFIWSCGVYFLYEYDDPDKKNTPSSDSMELLL